MGEVVRWPISGACGHGHHEGEQHRNWKGTPMPFCRGRWVSTPPGQKPYQHDCKCVCHEKITAMFEEVGRERIWLETDKWWKADDEGLPERPHYWGPWNDPNWHVVGPKRDRVVTASQVEERRASEGSLTPNEKRIRKAIEFKMLPPNPDYVTTTQIRPDEEAVLRDHIRSLGLSPKSPDVVAEEVGQQQGRRSGQLEYEVKAVCDLWTIGLMPDVPILTCSEIARAINPAKPPSTGAITNVLARWDEIGFAVHERQPHRFGGYTPEGIQRGVTAMQADRERTLRIVKGAKGRSLGPVRKVVKAKGTLKGELG